MKALIIISICLIVVGALLGFLALFACGFNFNSETTTESFDITEEISSVSITATDESTAITVKKGDSAKIDFVHSDGFNLSYQVTDGNLCIKSENKNHRLLNHIINFGVKNEIILTLPEAVYDSITVENTTGDISISELCVKTLSIDATTADFYIKDVSADSVTAKITTGDINAERLSVNGPISLKTTTGDVTLSSISGTDLRRDGSTGDFSLCDSTLGSITYDVTTGDAVIERVSVENSVSLKSTTGDICAESCDFKGNITAKATTGKINMTILSAKIFEADATTGSVDVPDSDYSSPYSCCVNTTTGDITVRVLK